jgi:hypothetical protein
VLKLNQVEDIPTGIYAHRLMYSAFWPAETDPGAEPGRLLKWSLAYHDFCGNSFKQATRRGDALTYQAFTYWDGMAEARQELPVTATMLCYNELPVKLRSLDWPAAQGKTFTVLVAGDVTNSKTRPIEFQPATLLVVEGPQHYEVTPARGDGKLRDVYAFGKEFPYVLQQHKRADGGHLTLHKSERLAYWERHGVTDQPVQ